MHGSGCGGIIHSAGCMRDLNAFLQSGLHINLHIASLSRLVVLLHRRIEETGEGTCGASSISGLGAGRGEKTHLIVASTF